MLTDPVWWFYLFWLPKFLDTRYGVQLSGLAAPLVAAPRPTTAMTPETYMACVDNVTDFVDSCTAGSDSWLGDEAVVFVAGDRAVVPPHGALLEVDVPVGEPALLLDLADDLAAQNFE